MPLQIDGSGNIFTPGGDSGTYTWTDIEALGSTKLTTCDNGSYQWRGIIEISSSATLNILEKTIELFGADSSSPGIIRATGSGKINFGETQTVDGEPVYSKGCNLTVRRSFSVVGDPSSSAFSYSDINNRFSTGSSVNLYATRVYTVSTVNNIRVDLFISNAYDCIFSYYNLGEGNFLYLQNGGSYNDCIFDRVNIEVVNNYLSFKGCKSYNAGNAIVFYSGFQASSRRDIVREFSPIGAAADYYVDARNALTFINSPDVDLSKGKIDDYSHVTVQAETFKGFEHIYKLVDSNGAVSGAEIRFTGFQTLTEVTDAAGSAPAFALVVERTDIVGTGTRNPPTPRSWNSNLYSID
jgi:hypothetical protein